MCYWFGFNSAETFSKQIFTLVQQLIVINLKHKLEK